jgi:hypothetical protein
MALMVKVARHRVDQQRIAEALRDIQGKTNAHWEQLRWHRITLRELQEARDELLDYVAARTLDDPLLWSPGARVALRTASACAFGLLELSVFPDGDWRIKLPLIAGEVSSDDEFIGRVDDLADHPATPGTWVSAFGLSLISSLCVEPWLAGVLLKLDYAPELRVPGADPAALAEMDALCCYLAPDDLTTSTVPAQRIAFHMDGKPTLRKPDAGERGRAALGLDEAGPLTPDQRLLRVLLDDDQPAFEQALADRLIEHRETAQRRPAPRTLLPVTAIALATLAVLVHEWQVSVHSDYLPAGLVYGLRMNRNAF